MHTFYETSNLSLDEKLNLFRKAKEKCVHWWVDVLDCSKSFARQRIEMSFDDILQKLNDDAYVTVIHRRNPVGTTEYLEIGFGTMTSLNYFLWVILDIEHLEEFTSGLRELENGLSSGF